MVSSDSPEIMIIYMFNLQKLKSLQNLKVKLHILQHEKMIYGIVTYCLSL